jgi:protein TonB
LGLEPSFSRNTLAWPLAGAGMLPLEPSDPALVIPRGALQLCPRDMVEQGSIVGIDPELASPQDESQTTAPTRPAVDARKWPIAVVASCVLHAAVAMVLLSAPLAWRTPEDPTQVEGADQAGMMLAGNANEDQAMAGDVTKVTLVPMVEPKPIKTVEAQPVTAEESVQPVEQTTAEAPVAETLEPVTETPQTPTAAEKVQPEPSDQVAPENPEPEILAAAPELPDSVDNFVQQPARTDSVKPVEDVKTAVQPATETEPPEAISTPKVVEVVPEPRPVEQKAPAAKPKPIKQAREETKETPAKPVRRKTSVGSGGANQADAKRGVADGRTKGDAAITSKGGAKSSVGNAAVSNYPGKVAARLRRVARGLSRAAQASARNNAQVSFVVGAGGDVRSIRLVKSSGSPGLDEAALSIIQRAAPFPPIPPQAERASWAFTLPIGPF